MVLSLSQFAELLEACSAILDHVIWHPPGAITHAISGHEALFEGVFPS